MDTPLTYARELQAAGYTLVQIQELLLARGVEQQTVYMVLRTMQDGQPAAPQTGQTTMPQAKAGEHQAHGINLPAYVDYVKDLRTRGLSWHAIDDQVATQGLSPSVRSTIYATVRDAEIAVVSKSTMPQVSSPATPQAAPPVPAVVAAIPQQLATTTEQLEQAVDHLSGIIDELDNELHSTAMASAPSNEVAERLAPAASHLTDAVKKLESDVTRPPFPSGSAAVPTIATQPTLAVPPDQQRAPLPDALSTPSTPAKPVAKLNIPLLGSCAVIFGVLFILSLLSHDRSIIWLALISMNVVGTAGFDLLLRGSSWRQVNRWLTATILQTGLFLPFLAKEIVRPIHFPHYTPFDILLLCCAVTMLVTVQFCNVKALQYLEASIFSVVYNTRVLFATLLGVIFLSESVGILALVGGLLIFIAIFIVRQRGAKVSTKQGIIFGLATALAMSSMNTCEKELIKLVGYEQYIFPMFGIAAIIMWAVVLLRRTEAPFRVLFQPRGLVLMALRACAGIGFSYSLVFGPVAVSSYLSSLSVVLIVVFGMLFLGERDYLKSKLAATGTAVIGLTFVLLDSL